MDKSSAAASGNPAAAAAAPEAAAAAAGMFARTRVLMLISALTTALAIAAVLGVIGYRLVRAGAGAGNADANVNTLIPLPNGARIVATAVSGDRIVVRIDIGNATEIRTYDVRTLQETGRLRFTPLAP